MKCSICGAEITETFLGKIRGTYIKKKAICPKCQADMGLKEMATRADAKE